MIAQYAQWTSPGNHPEWAANLEKALLQADQRLFNRFKKAHVEKSIKTAAEVIDVLHENSLNEMTPEFSKVASILAIIPATSRVLTVCQNKPAGITIE